jgi:hypothetical protein
MATRRTPQDTLKEAVERTVAAGQVTRGSVDELVGRVRGALEASRPATHDDIAELRKELRKIVKRLDAIEKKLSKK